jgi:cellulose 1,4-beta-cellobiosidase
MPMIATTIINSTSVNPEARARMPRVLGRNARWLKAAAPAPPSRFLRRPFVGTTQAGMTRPPSSSIFALSLAVVAPLACASSPAPTVSGGASLAATTGDQAPTDTPPLPAADGNPFLGAAFFVNPAYRDRVEEAARTVGPTDAALMRKAAAFPTAVWLSSIADVKTLGTVLDEGDAQQKKLGKPLVSVFSLYDLPGRDCNAKASAGELPATPKGEQRYRAEFIDPIAAQFQAHPHQRIVVVLETDSLANIATNLGNPACAAADQPYRRSMAYAISKLAMPHVSIYLDAAHAGWLGWGANRAKIAAVYKDVLAAAGGADKIRGFSTNVSNYNPLRGDEGKRLEPTNPCPNELAYVNELADSLRWAGIPGKAFLVDTSRNGRGGLRQRWGSWCNVNHAGLGERPQAAPVPFVDAYYWIKPPGESDGTADPHAARFDEACGNPDAAPGAPEAGSWFQSYYIDLLRNAAPPL